MKLSYILTISFIIISTFSECSTPEPYSIDGAHNAYFKMDHKQAYEMYSRLFSDSLQSLKDRASAGRNKARMAWLFYEDTQGALETIEKTLRVEAELDKTWLLKARILESDQKFVKALHCLDAALEQADSEAGRYRILKTRSEYRINALKPDLKRGNRKNIASESEFQAHYQEFLELAAPLAGDVNIANIQLIYALLARDGENAYRAWMSYYRLTNNSQVHPSLLKDVDSFESALKSIKENMDEETLKTVVMGLAESGFYEYASLFWINNQGKETDDPKIRDLLLYQSFLEDVNDINIDYHLQVIADSPAKSKRIENYQMSLVKRSTQLWNEIHWEGEAPEFSREELVRELRDRFKAIAKFISAEDVFGLHMGHIILDDKRVIKQYNQEAEFRYIAIDHMVSNGFSAWYWDGQAQTGGWAGDDGAFLQVRSAYYGGPIHTWSRVTDSVEIAKRFEKLKTQEKSDDSLARKNPYAYLPGLDSRLNYYQPKLIYDSLKAAGLAGAELRLNFINQITTHRLQSSIFAHEGRHAIDKKNDYSSKSAELEFTAKLSEVYFAYDPKYAFTAIMGRNIGDDTPHGKANLRVVKGLVKWMKKHTEEIKDLDTDSPLLPQMDKLTNDQLRAAMKSMDPMGNN